MDNSITYVLPKLVDGLSAQVQYSTRAGEPKVLGSETAGDKTGRLYGLSVQYAAGGFGAGGEHLEAKANDLGAEERSALAYLSYDFTAAKVTGYYNRNASGLNLDGARYPVRCPSGCRWQVLSHCRHPSHAPVSGRPFETMPMPPSWR